MDFDFLPNSWVRLFISSLPDPLKLILRQCNKTLQVLTDSTANLELILRDGCHGSAIALCKDQIASLRVLGGLQQDSAQQLAQQITGLGGLPSLQHLSCGILQPGLIEAVALSSSNLRSLRLCSVGSYQSGPAEYWQQQLQKMAVLKDVQSLRSLHIDNLAADTGVSAEQTLKQCKFVGTLTQLQSLSLTRHYNVTYAPFDLAEAYWSAAVKPLVNLTSLSLCGQLAVPADAKGLHNLRQLSCVFKRLSVENLILGVTAVQDYQWLAKCSNLTQLQLHCFVNQLNFAALAQLKQLASLTLCYSAAERLYSTHLQLLTACKQLTALEVDSFTLLAPPGQQPATLSTTATLGSSTATSTDAAAAVAAPAVDSSSISSSSSAAHALQQKQQLGQQEPQVLQHPTWQLTSLRKLSVGNIGVAVFHAPISTLAPNLTELSDTVEPDAVSKKWSPLQSAKPSCHALTGLRNLQVLWLDITCLVTHLISSSTVAASLTSLRELHVEMMGYLDKPEVRDSGGLWRIPNLEVLEMYTNDFESEDWADTYLSAEDVLIWQNQSTVKTLVVRGSSRLGGFVEHVDLLNLLSLKLPHLRRLEFTYCEDLCFEQLHELLQAKLCTNLVVRGSHALSAAECRNTYKLAQEFGVCLNYY